MRYARFIAVSAVVASATTAGAQTKEPYPGLDAYIAKARETWKIPGLAVGIVRNDSLIYAKGFGVLEAGKTTPVNEKTLFEIGSSSKAFTATIAAMLVTDGKMRWDDRLTTYLPDFKMYDAVANEAVTIRDALSHRSGIARGELVWLGSDANRDQVLHRVRFLKPESPFRSKWSYQNMMFLAVGQAEGRLMNTSWDTLVKKRIFEPLGMTSTVPTAKGLNSSNRATAHGIDKDVAFTKPEFNADNIAPAGAIISNVVDMAQWLRFQLNDGVVNGKRLVSSAALRETHTPQMLVGGGLGGGRGGADSVPTSYFQTYGFGWIVEDYRHYLVWQHGGNTPGMTTALGMMPEKKFGVVVLSSMASAALPDILRRYIFDREIGAPMRDLSDEAYKQQLNQRKRADSLVVVQAGNQMKSPPPLALDKYAGAYVDSLYGEFTIAIKNGALEMTRAGLTAPLVFWSTNNFRWMLPPSEITGPMFIKFDVSPENAVTGLFFGLGADNQLVPKKAAPGGGRGGRGGRGGGGTP
jgi:CubicO group peptidase (beta-lactamase class C family)